MLDWSPSYQNGKECVLVKLQTHQTKGHAGDKKFQSVRVCLHTLIACFIYSVTFMPGFHQIPKKQDPALYHCGYCKNDSKVIRLQRSGIDTIKYHTWPRIPMGKWQTHRRHHKRKPRGQLFPSRWPQSTYKQTHTKHSKHKTEQKHKRSTKEVPPWNGQ